MKVTLPSPLIDYTSGRKEVAAIGATLDGVLVDLDRQYPGIRFRMIDEQGRVRPHIKLFVNREIQRDISIAVTPDSEVLIITALSGG